jgi:cytochrome c oxidase subunit 2
MRRAAQLAAVVLPLSLGSCGGSQSALSSLFWVFFWISSIIWVLVVVVLIIALFRRHAERPDPLLIDLKTEHHFGIVVTGLALMTGAIVIALSLLSFAAQAQLFGRAQHGLTLKIIGHQWWWEVQYEDTDPSRTVTTANEIHLPIGEPVTIQLSSGDVIHSFWVPSLMGKMDAVPGRNNEVDFTIGKPGIYRGQCAEFCGLQHAHMAITVFAQSKADFSSWRERQILPAPTPEDSARKKGEQVFLSHPCVTCHTIRGTPAGGRTGPDLTHLASRTTLGAGTLPFSRGSLAAWITDPQSSKPGVHMPFIDIAPDDLHVLLDYLEGLQ